MSLPDNISILCFKAISDFVKDLVALFGKKQHPIILYSRLLSHTTFYHNNVISRHVEIFKTFCKENIEALTERDDKKLKVFQIKYSEKVYIDIKYIFENISNEEKESVWKHLLTIFALIDPSSNAKSLIVKDKTEGGEGTEKEFVNNIISEVTNCINPNDTNPMSVISSIMTSGVFSKMVGTMNEGLETGDFKMDKLMQVFNGLVNNLGEKEQLPPEMRNMTDTLKKLTNIKIEEQN